MHPPCEIMVESFLPAMRALVARKLGGEGMSQGKIASLLAVTQPSVSLYFSQPRGKPLRTLRELGISDDDSEMYASLLAEDLKKSPLYALGTLYSVWSDLLGRGALCAAHRRDFPSLAQCDMCVRTFGAKERGGEGAIEHVANAVRLVENSSIFVRVMPEVSVNIAYAGGEAKSVDDIVAIPGRIVKVKGAARSFMRPEFGASTHLAEILLQVMVRRREVRAAMNLRYDARMERVLKALRLRPLAIGDVYPEAAEDRVVGALKEKLATAGGGFDVVVDMGGAGLEPSLYIFAEDAVQVVNLGMKMAREYFRQA